jgi:heptosyltransferase-3
MPSTGDRAPRPRFLFLRGGAIGDFLVTLPVLRALRDRWPGAHIELVGYPHIARLALLGGLVDHVASLDAAGIARFFSLRPQFPDEQKAYVRSFELVFLYLHDPGEVVRENLQLAGATQVIYGSPIVRGGHAVDHLLKPLETLAIYEQGAAPALAWPEALRAEGRARLEQWGLGGRVLAIHPGSGSRAKNWPAAQFAALAKRAAAEGLRPFFLIGEAEAELGVARALVDAAPGVPHVVGLELEEAASVLSASERYVGNDSGITHLASALGLPVVALFGPSDPASWGPRGARVRVLRGAGDDVSRIGVDAAWEALVSQ